MMRLSGVGTEVRYGKHMAGAKASKGGIQEDSKVLKMGKDKNPEEEEDNAVKKLQSQINALRDKIQDIGKSETMDPKTKAELIQSAKEQITELNVQLKQRQADLEQEKLEEAEKAQEENKPISADDKTVSKNTGKSKYDTYSEDGEDSVKNVSKLSAAVVSASNSIELSRMQRYNMTYKKNSIGILKKEIVEDTDYIGKTVFVGHEDKEIGQILGESDFEGQEAASENTVDEDSPLKKTIEVPILEKKFEFLRGAGIEMKEDQIARFRKEISGLRKMQAEHLGDALRVVNGYNENAGDVKAGKTGKTAGVPEEDDKARAAESSDDKDNDTENVD